MLKPTCLPDVIVLVLHVFFHSLSALTADDTSRTVVYVYSSVLSLKKVRRGEGNYTWWQGDFGESQICHEAMVYQTLHT